MKRDFYKKVLSVPTCLRMFCLHSSCLKNFLTWNKLIQLNNIFIDFLNDINKIYYQVTLSTFYLLHILLHIQRFYK